MQNFVYSLMAVVRHTKVRHNATAAMRGFAIEYGSVKLGMTPSGGASPPIPARESIADPALMI